MTTRNSRSDLLAQLERGIADLTTSATWRDYLVFQSRFHRYSYGNVLLIASQDRRATQVAGFKAWQGLNRFVRKGEKAIWILAPMIGKATEPEEGESGRCIRGFKYVPVFDIAQTDGDDPPAVCTKLSGDDPGHLYDRLRTGARSLGFSVEDHEFGDSTNGDCSPSEERIRVEVRNSPAQRVKTLAHELAHALLHQTVVDRALAELEAESTAYVVGRAVGIDTGDYSFGYVAAWAGGGDEAIARIRASCDRIQKAASTILGWLQDEETPAVPMALGGALLVTGGAGRTR
jgi:antirestriction protein ArdC